jgi:hypothetical protein
MISKQCIVMILVLHHFKITIKNEYIQQKSPENINHICWSDYNSCTWFYILGILLSDQNRK